MTQVQLQILILLVAANAAPIVAANTPAKRFTRPLDGGLKFVDGRPLLGPSKTIRGVVASIATTILIGPLVGISWHIAALVGTLAMLGDATSSFIKRRMKMPSSSMAPGLDQVPECLFPLLALHAYLGLNAWDIVVVLVTFVLVDVLLSPLLYRAHIRSRPY